MSCNYSRRKRLSQVFAGMPEAGLVRKDICRIICKMCSARGNMYGVIKEIFKINENLDLGGVRKPLPALTEEDMAVVKEAAGMIRDAKEKYVG